MRKRREGGKAEFLSATLENRASTSWAFAVMYYFMIPTTRDEIENGNRYAMAMIWQETTGNDLLIRGYGHLAQMRNDNNLISSSDCKGLIHRAPWF